MWVVEMANIFVEIVIYIRYFLIFKSLGNLINRIYKIRDKIVFKFDSHYIFSSQGY